MKELECYGTWKVTTEGDCEGRSTHDLGTHTGNLDDIAFALADKAYYGLRFDSVNPAILKGREPTKSKVEVSLDIKSGTWNMDHNDQIAYFKRMLRGRDVAVKPGTYYACVSLVSGSSPEAQADAKKRVLRQAAIEKLSPEEREALGV